MPLHSERKRRSSYWDNAVMLLACASGLKYSNPDHMHYWCHADLSCPRYIEVLASMTDHKMSTRSRDKTLRAWFRQVLSTPYSKKTNQNKLLGGDRDERLMRLPWDPRNYNSIRLPSKEPASSRSEDSTSSRAEELRVRTRARVENIKVCAGM